MSIANFSEIIARLEFARESPRKYIGEIVVASMESFIEGFNQGCWALNRDINQEQHRHLIDEVTIERGWHFSSVSVSREMKRRGLSDETIIQELLTIEIEAWRRMEAILSK